MRNLGRFCVALLVALVVMPLRAPAATPTDAALDEIWAMEAKIYAGRASGTMQPYVDAVSEKMLSFPFGYSGAMDHAAFVRMAKQFKGNQENNTVYLKGFYLIENTTAVIFYRAHRTVRPDGTAVDEYWDTTHIYAREKGKWRLMSSINRSSDNKEISSTRPPISPKG